MVQLPHPPVEVRERNHETAMDVFRVETPPGLQIDGRNLFLAIAPIFSSRKVRCLAIPVSLEASVDPKGPEQPPALGLTFPDHLHQVSLPAKAIAQQPTHQVQHGPTVLPHVQLAFNAKNPAPGADPQLRTKFLRHPPANIPPAVQCPGLLTHSNEPLLPLEIPDPVTPDIPIVARVTMEPERSAHSPGPVQQPLESEHHRLHPMGSRDCPDPDITLTSHCIAQPVVGH
jgi:hypothetical protein